MKSKSDKLIFNMLEKWQNVEIEDCGGVTSQQYREFEKEFKKVLKEICNDIDFTLAKFNKGHYEFSAVVQSNSSGLYYYICIFDVRYYPNNWSTDILYRQMRDESDYVGYSNHYSKLCQLADNLSTIDTFLD